MINQNSKLENFKIIAKRYLNFSFFIFNFKFDPLKNVPLQSSLKPASLKCVSGEISNGVDRPAKNFAKRKIRREGNGFTLVELLVTIGIIAVVSALVVARYPDFSEQQSLERASRLVALSIREIQIRAMSIREFGGVFPAYGIRFSAAANDEFILFADLNDNQKYDGGGESLEQKKITTSARITDLCGNAKASPPGQCGLANLDIIFKRPDPLIFLKGNSGALSFSDVEVILQLPSGKQKTVGVWLSGQVFIE